MCACSLRAKALWCGVTTPSYDQYETIPHNKVWSLKLTSVKLINTQSNLTEHKHSILQHNTAFISNECCIILQYIRSRWRSGLARLQQWSCYQQGPWFESHLWPVEFFSCKKVSPLLQSNPNANICAMWYNMENMLSVMILNYHNKTC